MTRKRNHIPTSSSLYKTSLLITKYGTTVKSRNDDGLGQEMSTSSRNSNQKTNNHLVLLSSSSKTTDLFGTEAAMDLSTEKVVVGSTNRYNYSPKTHLPLHHTIIKETSNDGNGSTHDGGVSQHDTNPPPAVKVEEVEEVYDDNNIINDEEGEEEVYEDAPLHQGLLNRQRKSRRRVISQYYMTDADTIEWMRPYWLGSSLCLILFAFWILDSIKDPLFARLVDGKLEQHQPNAKLCSVLWTLILVCGMEYMANRRLRQVTLGRSGNNDDEEPGGTKVSTRLQQDQILEDGGIWTSMTMHSHEYKSRRAVDDTIPISLFHQVGIPYVVAFAIMGIFIIRFQMAEKDGTIEKGFDGWYILAYVLHATVESFGSIVVATFWSYTNSTLCLEDAERYYGPIIALAELGAIAGSTVVASGRWRESELLFVVSIIIIIQIFVMKIYDQKFFPTCHLSHPKRKRRKTSNNNQGDDERSILTWQDHDATLTKPFWSGIYLIFNHYYVILVLGVSCLYEVALTCLDYQMKLLGYAKYASTQEDPIEILARTPDMIMTSTTTIIESPTEVTMSFTEFMGHYGQVVNVSSFLLSSMIFPVLINRLGLRLTLLIFPTFLFIITIIAYGAMPGNLTVLFVSLSLLKAMTYSLHDPAKELLYIPTSNAVKFRAKFWIDVVGERISKAIGGVFNTFSGSVEMSIRVGSLPSLLSGAGLWFACFYVGIEFDRLLRTGRIVGLENSTIDPLTYKKLPRREEEIEFDYDDDEGDTPFPYRAGGGRGRELSEVELLRGDDDNNSFSTLGLETIDGENRRDRQDRSPLFLKTIPTIVRI